MHHLSSAGCKRGIHSKGEKTGSPRTRGLLAKAGPSSANCQGLRAMVRHHRDAHPLRLTSNTQFRAFCLTWLILEAQL